MKKRVLVFPGGMPRSLAFLEQALVNGQDVIGSSSLPYDPAKSRYSSWCYLPFVTEVGFDAALKQLVNKFQINEIFSPNIVVWNYLSKILPDVCPAVTLANASPLDAQVLPYQRAIDFAAQLNRCPVELGELQSLKPLLSDLRLASLFHHAELIPGMCDHEKIRALYSVFRASVEGDVVEIGSWWGKSAFVLLSLSRSFGVGKLLCVDPWSNEYLPQGGAKNLIDSIEVDADGALKIFQMNLLSFSSEDINYLRLPSVEAASVYRKNTTVFTDEFGETIYKGRISILHIDGNHTYANVKKDVDAWADLVAPGGWLIFDDYLWPYGEGPKQVGDQYLFDHSDLVDYCFVMGSALFVRKRPSVSTTISSS